MRAVLTRIVTSGRVSSPSKRKSNNECMKSTFSARVAEQTRARAHLCVSRTYTCRVYRTVIDSNCVMYIATIRYSSRGQQAITCAFQWEREPSEYALPAGGSSALRMYCSIDSKGQAVCSAAVVWYTNGQTIKSFVWMPFSQRSF